MCALDSTSGMQCTQIQTCPRLRLSLYIHVLSYPFLIQHPWDALSGVSTLGVSALILARGSVDIEACLQGKEKFSSPFYQAYFGARIHKLEKCWLQRIIRHSL